MSSITSSSPNFSVITSEEISVPVVANHYDERKELKVPLSWMASALLLMVMTMGYMRLHEDNQMLKQRLSMLESEGARRQVRLRQMQMEKSQLLGKSSLLRATARR